MTRVVTRVTTKCQYIPTHYRIPKRSNDTIELKLLPHSLGMAYRGSSLVCHSITCLAYSTAYGIVYVVFLACIYDSLVLALKIIISDREFFFKSYA